MKKVGDIGESFSNISGFFIVNTTGDCENIKGAEQSVSMIGNIYIDRRTCFFHKKKEGENICLMFSIKEMKNNSHTWKNDKKYCENIQKIT